MVSSSEEKEMGLAPEHSLFAMSTPHPVILLHPAVRERFPNGAPALGLERFWNPLTLGYQTEEELWNDSWDL
jgi:hypothetical protein